jgi:hypothetical protein
VARPVARPPRANLHERIVPVARCGGRRLDVAPAIGRNSLHDCPGADSGGDGEKISRHGLRDRVAPTLQPLSGHMPPEPNWPDENPRDTPVHRFTVHRGMVVVVVIETPDWYSGLIQAAATRIRMEGAN